LLFCIAFCIDFGGLFTLKCAQCVDVYSERFESLAPPQIRQINHESTGDNIAAQLLNQLYTGFCGPSGGEQVINDEDVLARLDGVVVDLNGGLSIFEFVAWPQRPLG